MLSEKMTSTLNKQINMELYSSYIYMAMSEYFQANNLKGFANWMNVQAGEELSHANKIRHYLNEQGARVVLSEVGAPPKEWDSPLAAFEAALGHEKKVTASIKELVTLAKEEKDYATEIMLGWFVSEQVEEESSADEIVQKLRMIKDSAHGLFMMDSFLGQRK
ncbi:MAG: ferritin [Phycisphaerae bacterium]|jgi:ferritin|nr:ferritin [Phycisphaerae bacterium]